MIETPETPSGRSTISHQRSPSHVQLREARCLATGHRLRGIDLPHHQGVPQRRTIRTDISAQASSGVDLIQPRGRKWARDYQGLCSFHPDCIWVTHGMCVSSHDCEPTAIHPGCGLSQCLRSRRTTGESPQRSTSKHPSPRSLMLIVDGLWLIDLNRHEVSFLSINHQPSTINHQPSTLNSPSSPWSNDTKCPSCR